MRINNKYLKYFIVGWALKAATVVFHSDSSLEKAVDEIKVPNEGFKRPYSDTTNLIRYFDEYNVCKED